MIICDDPKECTLLKFYDAIPSPSRVIRWLISFALGIVVYVLFRDAMATPVNASVMTMATYAGMFGLMIYLPFLIIAKPSRYKRMYVVVILLVLTMFIATWSIIQGDNSNTPCWPIPTYVFLTAMPGAILPALHLLIEHTIPLWWKQCLPPR